MLHLSGKMNFLLEGFSGGCKFSLHPERRRETLFPFEEHSGEQIPLEPEQAPPHGGD
jgi:hypothetical protein